MDNIAYQHRPLSKILAKTAEDRDVKSQTEAPKERKTADDSNIPEKYRGKSAEDIIEMHRNSEKRLGELQNEVGQLRGLVSDLSQLQRPDPSPTEEEDLDLSGDDLLQNPADSIRKVVQRELKPLNERSEMDRKERDLEKATGKLYNDFPNMEEIVMQPEFLEFVERTSSRQRLRDIAATGQGIEAVDAARTLLEDFDDFQKSASPQKEKSNRPIDKAREVANEGKGGDARVKSEDLIYEADVIKLINSDPEKYRSPGFQKGLMKAIREGRYIKQ